MNKIAENAAKRQKFADDLGLQGLTSMKVQHNTIDHVVIYHWPAGGDRKYDRNVLMLVYEDGSFTTALDDGHLSIEGSKRALQAMAIAAESI